MRKESFVGGFNIDETGKSDNLAIALAYYFEHHHYRPIDDEETKEESNSYLGEWVYQKTCNALDLIEGQFNDEYER